MLTHAFTGIQAKGVTANYNTNVNKHGHRWAQSVYRCGSKKGIREQVNIITSSILWPLISSIRLQSKINGLPYLIWLLGMLQSTKGGKKERLIDQVNQAFRWSSSVPLRAKRLHFTHLRVRSLTHCCDFSSFSSRSSFALNFPSHKACQCQTWWYV